MAELTPGELVSRIREGDLSAWPALNERYIGLLWAVARGMRLDEMDAEDAIQTTWLRLVENLGALRDPEYVGSWLVTTVRRECLATLRRRVRVRAGLDQTISDEPAPPDTGPEDVLLLAERDAALWRAFRRLAPRCQHLLRVLMADPPPSYAEVAAALDCSPGYIGPTRKRCLEQLRTLLAAHDQPPGGSDSGSLRHG
ncbi:MULTISPECIES: RNA polymerase sigma factor [Pseudofrankia]|uniref:RNA polymerase sigma factor n=1 Tax=Pseudofrankia TaxID=2994363 RepID=UPI0007C5C8D5|nr:hypothetical protein BCD49_11625 [Pseudofrankia sp. EUN1h]